MPGREKLALPVAEWPERDRAAWATARQPAGLFDEDGLAASWSAKTARQVEKSYGLWLGFLHRHEMLDQHAAPGERLTTEALTGFVEELTGRVASKTAAARVRDLTCMVRVIAPEADRTAVQRLKARLERTARPSRPKRAKMLSPSVLFEAGVRRMERNPTEQHVKLDVRLSRFRDGLMIAFLAARPIRRGNLTAMRLGQHLLRTDEGYLCRFGEDETKNGRPLDFTLPEALTPWLDRYLAEIRPQLLRGHASDAVWVSTYRKPITEQSIYLRIRAATLEETGVELTPHLFRDCLSTGIAVEDPAHVRITPRLLGHADERTAERHYTHARALTASRRLNDVLLRLRAAALDETEESSPCAP